MAEYSYDAWGKHTVTNHTIDNIGDINPIRYRGYYYDTETNLYYLRSRYYDPATGRFINADEFEYAKPMQLGGLNLYSYCNNNPVMLVDANGTFFKAIGNFFNKKVVQPVTKAATSVVNFVDTKIVQPVVNTVKSAVDGVVDFVDKNIVQPVVNTVKSAVDSVVDFVDTNIVQPVVNVVKEIGNAVVNTVTTAVAMAIVSTIGMMTVDSEEFGGRSYLGDNPDDPLNDLGGVDFYGGNRIQQNIVGFGLGVAIGGLILMACGAVMAPIAFPLIALGAVGFIIGIIIITTAYGFKHKTWK